MSNFWENNCTCHLIVLLLHPEKKTSYYRINTKFTIMRKIYLTMAMMAMTAMPNVAVAQDGGDELFNNTLEPGYFRIVNNGYGDVLNVNQKYGFSLNATENSARTMPGSIFYYDTNGFYNIANDIQVLESLANDGFLDGFEFVSALSELTNRMAWKSGSYITYDISNQGISFVGGYLGELAKYVNAAFDNFHEGEEVKNWYENPENAQAKMWLQVRMSKFFNPSNMDTYEHFQGAVQNFMAVWKSFLDFNIYVSGSMYVENGFMLKFHSPADEVAGIQIQKTLDELANFNIDDQFYDFSFDFFGAVKRKVVEEAAKELDGDALAYIERILEPMELNKIYLIGENESGELYFIGYDYLDSTFGDPNVWDGGTGDGSSSVNINADEVTWIMQPVDEVNPLMVGMNEEVKDANGNYYTTMFTEFPYELKEGVEAYYIDAVNEGKANLVQIEGKVPAMTAVLLRSKNAAAVSNVVIPVDEEVPAIEGNLLKGTCLAMENPGNVSLLGVEAAGEQGYVVMKKTNGEIPANQCYIDTPEDGSSVIIAEAGEMDPTGIKANEEFRMKNEESFYSLSGQRVNRLQKGVFIQNGKKIVVK